MLREAFGSPRGALRSATGKQQYKIGKVEDENKELSPFEAELGFPGSVSAWTEIVPELFPDFPFHDPASIKKGSSFFSINGELRVAFKDMPQVELAIWHPDMEDWVEIEH